MKPKGAAQWPNPAVPLACEGAAMAPLPYITAEEVAITAFLNRAADTPADGHNAGLLLTFATPAAHQAALLALEGACSPASTASKSAAR
jgi:hypothetical protein